jgi:hypothetical protein
MPRTIFKKLLFFRNLRFGLISKSLHYTGLERLAKQIQSGLLGPFVSYEEIEVPVCSGLITNIRLGWKGLQGRNALAYSFSLLVTKKKSLITLTPGQCYKTFYSRKLGLFILSRAFVPGQPFQPSLMFVGKSRSLP